MSEVKKHKTFKDYYQDPEYRRRHLDKITEKVECECGYIGSKCYMSKHKKTAIHQKRLEKLDRLEALEEKKKRLNDRILKLKAEKKGVDKTILKIKKKHNIN